MEKKEINKKMSTPFKIKELPNYSEDKQEYVCVYGVMKPNVRDIVILKIKGELYIDIRYYDEKIDTNKIKK